MEKIPQLPNAALHTVPVATLASLGQAAEFPLQTSGASHTPELFLHVTPAFLNLAAVKV